MTIRAQILAAAIARLNTDRPQGIPEATSRRAVEGEEIDGPRIGVFLGNETVEQVGGRWGPLVERRQRLFVQCRDVTDRNEELDLITEPLLAWATAALVGQDFGGLAHDVQEISTGRDPQVGERYYQVATAEFVVNYQTRRNDQSSLA